MAGYLTYVDRFADRAATVVRANEHLPPHPAYGPMLGTGTLNPEQMANANAEPTSDTSDRRAVEVQVEPLVHRVHDQPELRPLVVLLEQVALHGGGEAALGGQREALQRHVRRRGLDPPPTNAAMLAE